MKSYDLLLDFSDYAHIDVSMCPPGRTQIERSYDVEGLNKFDIKETNR